MRQLVDIGQAVENAIGHIDIIVIAVETQGAGEPAGCPGCTIDGGIIAIAGGVAGRGAAAFIPRGRRF